MAFDALRSILDSPSLVIWFALLVTVFAVFVGLGLYAASRESRRSVVAQQDELAKQAEASRTPRERRSAARASRDAARHAPFRSRRELNHSQETP